ncbi:hypothetical protein ACGC1H_001119 [Rhizoctonia solani]|uniref:Uncharacterized protein n=1 Tax=Rhizoctonia solani TaxID=456999 RepID=A0A8H3A6D4_9AGAM|nr:unnamed protein product [Rhizoctonia solani]
MRFSILSLSIIAVAVGNVAGESAKYPSIKPPIVRHIDFANLTPAKEEPATNAVRFAQGLPPMRPRSRKHHPTVDITKDSLDQGTPVVSAPRVARSTLPPVQQSCNVLVKTSDKTLGYLSSTFNDYGLFYPTTQQNALVVSFSYLIGSFLTTDLRSGNRPSPAYPYVGGALGLVSDSADIGSGNSNFGYIVGTTQTPPTSRPVEGDNSLSAATGIPLKYESSIWVYNSDTKNIRAQWYNTDGSAPRTFLIYNEDLDGIALTGDPSAVRAAFGSTYPDVTMTCVPVVS